jgi:hypothetical protein
LDDISFLHNKLTGIMDVNDSYKNLSIDAIIKKALSEYKVLLFSNNFVDVESYHSQEAREIQLTDSIRGQSPYRIHFSYDNEMIDLFIQGKKVSFPRAENLPILIDRINSYELFSVDEIIQELRDEWDDETCLYFLGELYINNGIEVLSKQP